MEQSKEGQLTVFGRVVRGFMEARGVEDTPALVELANEKGLPLDGHALERRMRSTGYSAGYLDELADVLELAQKERVRLAMAYAFEMEV